MYAQLTPLTTHLCGRNLIRAIHNAAGKGSARLRLFAVGHRQVRVNDAIWAAAWAEGDVTHAVPVRKLSNPLRLKGRQ